MTQFIFVVGMHRSGTSVFAGSLIELGCAAPVVMLPAHASNPKGHFEPEAATTTNDAFLASLGHMWHTARPLPGDAFADAGFWVQRIADVLARDYPGRELAVVKDPRISLLLPLWRSAVTRMGHPEPVHALVFRPPGGTVASLSRRNGFTCEHSVALWLRYTLDAEYHTRGQRRCLVSIDEFTRNPVGVLDRVGADLGVTWPSRPEDRAAELDAFVDRDLLQKPQNVQAPLIVLAQSAFAALQALARNEADETARADLDRIRVLFDSIGNAPLISWSQEQIDELSARVARLNAEVSDLSAEVQAQRRRPLSMVGHLVGFHVLRLVARHLPLAPERWQALAQRRDPARPGLEGKALRPAARATLAADMAPDRLEPRARLASVKDGRATAAR